LRYVKEHRADNKGLATAGLTTSLIGLGICVMWLVLFLVAGLSPAYY
jgi:hypothetical protein